MPRLHLTAVVAILLLAFGSALGSCAWRGPVRSPELAAERRAALGRAQVWAPTNIRSMDLKTGPRGPGAFALGETVTCDYIERDMHGRSPKFTCVIPGVTPDRVKVKYGVGNAEVYGEVLSTRLLWALGFGADRMYPVRVICRGCPEKIQAERALPSGERVFDPAVIERKMPGRVLESRSDEGWSWKELDLVDVEAGGAPRSHRDGLKLLAVMLQHSDSKPSQQRLACLDADGPAGSNGHGAACTHPFMLVQDLGLTFGRSDMFYRDKNYVNLARWADTPVWTGSAGCVGNLEAPLFATLDRPVISESGRAFLAGLLGQLRDRQIRDLFEAARITRRPASTHSAAPTIDQWVAVFKHKRDEIASKRCERD